RALRALAKPRTSLCVRAAAALLLAGSPLGVCAWRLTLGRAYPSPKIASQDEAILPPPAGGGGNRQRTWRRVRLMRPPAGMRVEVPGMMRSMPWKASRAGPPNITTSPEESFRLLLAD